MIRLMTSLSRISSLNSSLNLCAAEEFPVSLVCPDRYSQPLPLHQLDVGDELCRGVEARPQFGDVDSFGCPEWPQVLHRHGEVIHDVGEADSLAGGDPFKPQPFRIHARMLQDSLGYQGIAQRIVVSLGVVVAVVQMTTADEHAVGSFGERPEDEFQIDPAGAHHAGSRVDTGDTENGRRRTNRPLRSSTNCTEIRRWSA